MELPLSALNMGEGAYIDRLEGVQHMTHRLAQLGFTPGTRVECELTAPSGDPSAYRVRGALIALRRSDAGQVYVTRADGEARA